MAQADEIVSMVVNEIPDIVSGTNSVAKFEATFSGIGELDDEKNHEIDQLKIILEKYVVFDDFEIIQMISDLKLVLKGKSQ